ncbi:hypothetical protein [uncultured Cloacibacillus sp.]|uniref:hypothetical protein n=1 Tax=uncultured Cloacibacillus sp. TaxID=889794 RepID=UPI0026DBE0A6|nr:hypothetical protein [uncultured Cloacibacillus sp.]
MAFECDFDFLSREQNEKLAAFINEMREFGREKHAALGAPCGGSKSSPGGEEDAPSRQEFVRVSRELKAVAKERDNYKAMLSGASKACEELRREYKAFRDGVSAAAEDIRAAGETSANLERVRAERDDLTARLKCANAEIVRLREEARRETHTALGAPYGSNSVSPNGEKGAPSESREANAASVEKMREKYEKKIAVLEDRLRGYRDYRARVARMAAMGPEDEVLCESVLKEGGAL